MKSNDEKDSHEMSAVVIVEIAYLAALCGATRSELATRLEDVTGPGSESNCESNCEEDSHEIEIEMYQLLCCEIT